MAAAYAAMISYFRRTNMPLLILMLLCYADATALLAMLPASAAV